MIQLDGVSLEYRVIMDLIPKGSSVLDLGCGDGKLLELLVKNRGVRGSGIEIDEQAIYKCVSRGLSVSHQDIDCGLADYGDKSFDFVVLNQSLQQVVKLQEVLLETMRVGKKVIVGFPNFCFWRARFQLAVQGRTPVTPSLPNMWYDTPNLHFLSIRDFAQYCREKGFSVETTRFVTGDKTIHILPNLFAQTGIFLIKQPLTK